MKKKLRITAGLLAGVILLFWLARGANTGWTKNSVPHTVKDPVTELEVQVYETKFVPGIEFLGGGLFVAAMLAGASLLIKNHRSADL